MTETAEQTEYAHRDELTDLARSGMIESARALQYSGAYLEHKIGYSFEFLTNTVDVLAPIYVIEAKTKDGRVLQHGMSGTGKPHIRNDLNNVRTFCKQVLGFNSFEVIGHD